MSDSQEVYNSKPSRIVTYTVYVILAIFAAAVVWASLSKMDVTVSSNGMFRSSEETYSLSSKVTGQVASCQVQNGDYVKQGTELYSIHVDDLDESIELYQTKLENSMERLSALKSYKKCLNGKRDALEQIKDNAYYHEFYNRYELLKENMNASVSEVSTQADVYDRNIGTINDDISDYQSKKKNYENAISCIKSRTNTFGDESYYGSIVSSYISEYNLSKTQYDNQLETYEEQLKEYQSALQTQNTTMSKEEIRSNIKNIKKQIKCTKDEKRQTLNNMELTQISALKQQIESVEDTITSLESSRTTAQDEKAALSKKNTKQTENIQLLTEQGTVSTEIETCKSELNEYKKCLKEYQLQKGNCTVVAVEDGYFYTDQNVAVGSYVQEGAELGKIYPDKEADQYYAEVYVENSDIAKLKEGQEVKFEIAAYPSSEYGYFTGKIEDIPQDITVDQNTGTAYYVVKVACDDVCVQGKEGENNSLMNGMACEANIITGEKKVMNYVLEQLDL